MSYFANIIWWYLAQIKGLSSLLKSSPDKGISGDDADLLKRKNAFGTNTYPRKKGRSFWVCSWCLYHYTIVPNELILILVLILCDCLQRFLWEAWQDLTLIILIVAAAVSLVLGIKTEVWSSLIFSNRIVDHTFHLRSIFTLQFLSAFDITKF